MPKTIIWRRQWGKCLNYMKDSISCEEVLWRSLSFIELRSCQYLIHKTICMAFSKLLFKWIVYFRKCFLLFGFGLSEIYLQFNAFLIVWHVLETDIESTYFCLVLLLQWIVFSVNAHTKYYFLFENRFFLVLVWGSHFDIRKLTKIWVPVYQEYRNKFLYIKILHT